MSSYCQTGYTARVTFPDSSIQDYSDTPITVKVTQLWGTSCQELHVRIRTSQSAYWINVPQADYNLRVYAPLISDWITEGQYRQYLMLKCRGSIDNQGYVCRDFQYWYAASTVYGGTGFDTVSFLEVKDYYQYRDDVINGTNNALPISPSYQFDIFGNSGITLFSGSFSTNNYNVECVQGCPPNTLDCGNGHCCDCSEIFNEISDIRRLLSILR